jgi:anti-sigma B factor antagonist
MFLAVEGPGTKRDEGLDVVDDGAVCVVRLAGEIDMANAGALRSHLAEVVENRAGPIVVDLSRVQFIDSSGVQAILSVTPAGEARDRRVRVVAGPPEVDRVFSLLGVKDRFDWIASPPGADSSPP